MKKVALGFLGSLFLHAALYGGARAWMAYTAAYPDAIDIDLSGSSLILRPHSAAGGRPANAVAPEPWILGSGRIAPQPKPLTFTPQAVVETEDVPCPPPCPARSEDWLPASATSEKPQWMSNFITQDDYPKEARQLGVTGMVKVVVLIDAQGVVRDVQVVESVHPSFNAMVIEKLKAARFRPAYDQSGNAVPCRLKLPLKFELL